jgi:hypothetical protein
VPRVAAAVDEQALAESSRSMLLWKLDMVNAEPVPMKVSFMDAESGCGGGGGGCARSCVSRRVRANSIR